MPRPSTVDAFERERGGLDGALLSNVFRPLVEGCGKASSVFGQAQWLLCVEGCKWCPESVTVGDEVYGGGVVWFG